MTLSQFCRDSQFSSKFTLRFETASQFVFSRISRCEYECGYLTRWYNVIDTGHLLLPDVIAGPAEQRAVI